MHLTRALIKSSSTLGRHHKELGKFYPQNFRSPIQGSHLIKKYTAWRWGEPTYIYNIVLITKICYYLMARFMQSVYIGSYSIYYISWDMNFGPVWFLVEWHPSIHPDRQTDRKWCIRAHRAIGTGGLKNDPLQEYPKKYWTPLLICHPPGHNEWTLRTGLFHSYSTHWSKDFLPQLHSSI